MRTTNVVSIGQVRRTAAQSRQARRAPAVLRFPEPPAPLALSAAAIDYAERIELLIAAGRPLAALDAILRHLEWRTA